MSDYIQNLNNLASVTSLSQLKLDGEGQLEKRSALNTLGHRIADAFRSLSAAGRTAISARNVELLSAMQKAVDTSTHHEVFLAREAGGRLEAALDRLQNRVDRDALFNQIKSDITSDPRFAQMPRSSKAALNQALENMTEAHTGAKPSEWKDCADALKWAFFGEQPSGLSLDKGIENFTESLKAGFLTPSMQAGIEDGFNKLTLLDFRRNAISKVGDIDTPRSMEDQFYKDALSSVMEGHEDLMPFVSTVITQNGLGTLAQRLPIDMGFNIANPLTLCDASRNPHQQFTDVTVRREGHELVVEARYENGFHVSGAEGKAFSQLAAATMRIDLEAAPERHLVDGREVLIPQFRLENVSMALNDPVGMVQADPRFQALPEYSQEALLKALGKVSHDEAKMQRLKDDFFGLSTGDMQKANIEYARDLRETFLNPAQQKLMKENDFFNNFGKDMRRGAVSSINGQPVPRGQSDEFYEDLLRNALPEEHHQLIPFISMMCSQAGLEAAKVDLPYLSGLTDLLISHLADVGIVGYKGLDSHAITMTIEDSRIIMKEDFVQRFTSMDKQWNNGDPTLLGLKGSATLVIDLDGIIEVETVNGKDVLLPPFHIENSEARFIPGEASYLKAD